LIEQPYIWVLISHFTAFVINLRQSLTIFAQKHGVLSSQERPNLSFFK
jgi:hypothetical protein